MNKLKDIQIRLRSDVPREREILEYLEKIGTRTGIPKQWLIAGYEKSLNNDAKEVVALNSESETKPKKPHSMSSFVSKG